MDKNVPLVSMVLYGTLLYLVPFVTAPKTPIIWRGVYGGRAYGASDIWVMWSPYDICAHLVNQYYLKFLVASEADDLFYVLYQPTKIYQTHFWSGKENGRRFLLGEFLKKYKSQGNMFILSTLFLLNQESCVVDYSSRSFLTCCKNVRKLVEKTSPMWRVRKIPKYLRLFWVHQICKGQGRNINIQDLWVLKVQPKVRKS